MILKLESLATKLKDSVDETYKPNTPIGLHVSSTEFFSFVAKLSNINVKFHPSFCEKVSINFAALGHPYLAADGVRAGLIIDQQIIHSKNKNIGKKISELENTSDN